MLLFWEVSLYRHNQGSQDDIRPRLAGWALNPTIVLIRETEGETEGEAQCDTGVIQPQVKDTGRHQTLEEVSSSRAPEGGAALRTH